VSVVLALVAGLVAGVAATLAVVAVRRRIGLGRRARRIAFPFIGAALSERALGAALRLARAEGATLVPIYLVGVPRHLPLDCAQPREAETALALLEAVEQRAARGGVAVDARVERGRSVRHALRAVVDHERFERMVVAAAGDDGDGFVAADVAWMLDHVPEEVLVVRPARQAPQPVPALSPPARPNPRRRASGSRAPGRPAGGG